MEAFAARMNASEREYDPAGSSITGQTPSPPAKPLPAEMNGGSDLRSFAFICG